MKRNNQRKHHGDLFIWSGNCDAFRQNRIGSVSMEKNAWSRDFFCIVCPCTRSVWNAMQRFRLAFSILMLCLVFVCRCLCVYVRRNWTLRRINVKWLRWFSLFLLFLKCVCVFMADKLKRVTLNESYKCLCAWCHSYKYTQKLKFFQII